MAYQKTEWKNNGTPAISSDNLNKMEDGIYEAHQNAQNIADYINILPFMVSDGTTSDTAEYNNVHTIDDITLTDGDVFEYAHEIAYDLGLEGLYNNNIEITISGNISYHVYYDSAPQGENSPVTWVLSCVDNNDALLKTQDISITPERLSTTHSVVSGNYSISLSLPVAKLNNMFNSRQQTVVIRLSKTFGAAANSWGNTVNTRFTDISTIISSVTIEKPNRYKITL